MFLKEDQFGLEVPGIAVQDLDERLLVQKYRNELQAVNSLECLYQVPTIAMNCMGHLHLRERGKQHEK